MKRVAISFIKFYQRAISPYIIRSCRYEPTCSQYAADAVEELGVLKGMLKAFWRVIRCNPFSPGGYDPIKRDKSKKG